MPRNQCYAKISWRLPLFCPTVPPVITSDTQTYVAAVDSSVTLQCRADGSPSPVVTWHKDGQPLRKTVRQRALSSGSLQIAFVQAADTGRYTCIAANAAGTVSLEISLTVQGEFQSLPRLTESFVLRERLILATFEWPLVTIALMSINVSLKSSTLLLSPTVHPSWRAGGVSGGAERGSAGVFRRRGPAAHADLGEGR